MKETSKLHQRYLALFVAICMAMAIPAAYAVVKNVNIVDTQGQSLANTKVTIVFPNGTEVEEETDDDGMLIFDFPSDGDYSINYPGGQMGVTVTQGAGKGKWIVGGAAAVGAGLVIAASGSDSDSGSGSGSNSSWCSLTPTYFDVTTSNYLNPGSHPTDGFDGTWQVSCDSPDQATIILASGASSNATDVIWSCTIDSSGNCNSSSAADCHYANQPASGNTVCSLQSQFSGSSSWSGTMDAGTDGNLPGGQAITASFSGT